MPKQPKKTAAPTRTGTNAFRLDEASVIAALVSGDRRALLEDYFGPENYSLFRDLARDTSTRSVRGGARVLILPGIMGSTLGKPGLLGLDDVLWIDPVEIAAGRLMELKLSGGNTRYKAVGVVWLAYLQLKLRLKIAGFDADFFPFDWRLSLKDLGAQLAAHLRQEPKPVSIVAHSMGGLVTRAALAAGAKIERLVMLGTPNYGSFAPVQAFRGTYDVVQKVAALDIPNDATTLANQVFNTFPGLYEMLPNPSKFSAVDLYNAGEWPSNDPKPRASRLAAVKAVVDALAPATDRFFLIAGINQDTVVGLRKDEKEFQYEVSPAGDGTVPLAYAQLDGMKEGHTYYVEAGHGDLPNTNSVIAAVRDLLSTGTTTALPSQLPPLRRTARVVTEETLRGMAARATGIGELGTADYRHLLRSVAAAPHSEQTAPTTSPSVAASAAPAFTQLTIGRRQQRRLELTLAQGSITEADARAYVLGSFRNVAPSGAALAIDQRLDGAVSEFTARRMLTGEAGTVFAMPVGNRRLPADTVVFAGLGAFDQFQTDVQQMVAENVARVLVRSRIDDFATILIGAGSGQSTAAAVFNLLSGFLRGLEDADPRQRFRRITLCELDPTRFAEMKSEIYRLASTPLFADVELTLDEVELAPAAPSGTRQTQARAAEPIYLMVRQEGDVAKPYYRISLLGAGMKAAVISTEHSIDGKALDTLLADFDKAAAIPGHDLRNIGRQFTDLVLHPQISEALQHFPTRHLVVVHDAATSRVPWEILTLPEDKQPALDGGLSRRYLAEQLPMAAWLEQRRRERRLQLLLIVNPTGDLTGAELEGDRLQQIAGAEEGINITTLRREHATRSAVLSAMRSGKFDCVHFAGHAFFDPKDPGSAGLRCAGGEVLRGADLTGISSLPFLIFMNACEAGRVRKEPATTMLNDTLGVAETLLRGGIANYLSTYWPVDDIAAKDFACEFYVRLLKGDPLSAALLAGRQKVGVKNRDWADFILYGDPGFVLKQPDAAS
jgi:pimeloyl-ACP methyl ester carboxylesterase